MASKPETRERATYVGLIGLFLSLFGLFAGPIRKRGHENPIRAFDVAMLSLATYRAGRLAAYDQVSAPLREPITETQPDEYGAGENVVAEGEGVRKAFGELVSCPTCVGTWVAAGLTYGMQIAPGPTRLAATMIGVAGAAEILDSAVEALTWTGKAARKQSAPE